MGWDSSPQEDPDFYWDKYGALQETDVASALMHMRLDLVKSYAVEDLVDVGIGAGQFVRLRPGTRGHDAGKRACDWLKEQGLWYQCSDGEVEAMSFWDSLEHIPLPTQLVSKIRRFAFVTIPIGETLERIISFKHFRPGEHCWYFTRSGLERWFGRQGFKLVEHNTMEQSVGREEVETFVFERL